MKHPEANCDCIAPATPLALRWRCSVRGKSTIKKSPLSSMSRQRNARAIARALQRQSASRRFFPSFVAVPSRTTCAPWRRMMTAFSLPWDAGCLMMPGSFPHRTMGSASGERERIQGRCTAL